MAFEPPLVCRAGSQRNDQHREIGQIAGQVIPEEYVIRKIENGGHTRYPALPGAYSMRDNSSGLSVPVRSTSSR